jgi:hypothetical protein
VTHLISLGFAVIPLQVDLLLNTFFPEDVVTPSLAFYKSQSEQNLAQILKGSIRV